MVRSDGLTITDDLDFEHDSHPDTVRHNERQRNAVYHARKVRKEKIRSDKVGKVDTVLS